MSNQKWLTPIFIVIVVLLSLAVFVSTKLANKKVNNPQKTDNWKVYENSKYGFEFKYEKNSIISYENDSENLGYDFLLVLNNESLVKDNKFRDDVGYFNIQIEKGKSCNEVVGKKFSKKVFGSTEYEYFEGYQAYGIYHRDACIVKGDQVFWLSNTTSYPENMEKSKKLFEQIITTFRLLNNTLKNSTEKLQEYSAPEKVTEDYYTWYSECVDDYFNNSTGKKLAEECPYEKDNILDITLIQELKKRVAFNPILCSQNTPDDKIMADKAIVTGDTAQTTIHTYYSGSGDNPITIKLRLINNQWKITNIHCPN